MEPQGHGKWGEVSVAPSMRWRGCLPSGVSPFPLHLPILGTLHKGIDQEGSTYTLRAGRHRDAACLGAWQLAAVTTQIQNVPGRCAALSSDDPSSPETGQTSATRLGRFQSCQFECPRALLRSARQSRGSIGLVAQVGTCFRRRERTFPAGQS